MYNTLWHRFCAERQIKGLAGCLSELNQSRCFYCGHTQNDTPMTHRIAFRSGKLSRLVKALAAVRYCVLTHVDMTEPLYDGASLQTLMHTDEAMFETQMTKISGCSMDELFDTFLANPLHLNYTYFEGDTLFTTPAAYATVTQALAAGFHCRSRVITPYMASLILTHPETDSLFEWKEDTFNCRGLIDSGDTYAVGFLTDIETRRTMVLMSDDPNATPLIENVLSVTE